MVVRLLAVGNSGSQRLRKRCMPAEPIGIFNRHSCGSLVLAVNRCQERAWLCLSNVVLDAMIAGECELDEHRDLPGSVPAIHPQTGVRYPALSSPAPPLLVSPAQSTVDTRCLSLSLCLSLDHCLTVAQLDDDLQRTAEPMTPLSHLSLTFIAFRRGSVPR